MSAAFLRKNYTLSLVWHAKKNTGPSHQKSLSSATKRCDKITSMPYHMSLKDKEHFGYERDSHRFRQ